MFLSKWINPKIITIGTAVLFLAGCGGSSSGSLAPPAPPPPPPPPPPANVAPTANAGTDQGVLAGVMVTLNGGGSTDSDGTVNGYAWTQSAGTMVTLDEAVPSMPTFVSPNIAAAETLTFDLIVTDDDGAASTADSVDVTVSALLALPYTDNFSDGLADGWSVTDDNIEQASNWAANLNIYVQNGRTNTEANQDRGDVEDGTYYRGTYSHLDDSNDLTDYRFSVDVNARPNSRDDIGVMFRYTNNDNYYRFTMNSELGYSRLESKNAGSFTTLSKNFRGYTRGQNMSIAVEVQGSIIQVFVNGDSIFAADNSDHAAGGVALYARDGARFDNVSLTTNSTNPDIVIASPVSHSLAPKGARDITVTAIARNVPAGGTVDIDMGACNVTATETSPGVFAGLCANQTTGDYLAVAILRDSGGVEVDRDTNTDVAVGADGFGDLYDAFGDSITFGLWDNYSRDNLNLADESVLSHQGWTGPLTDLLTTANSQPNIVSNEAVIGDDLRDLRFMRTTSIFNRNQNLRPNRSLVLIGTNDTTDFNNTAPGLGCGIQTDPACDRTYNGDMRWLIVDIGSRRDNIYVGILPPIWGDSAATIYDPADLLTANQATAVRSKRIQAFNEVITTELSLLTDVELGPDLFTCFLSATDNRFSMFHDSLHPNSLGYSYMAALWADAILNGVVPGTCPTLSSVYFLDDLDGYTHGLKQNLLEDGNEYYNDESFVLESIPAALQDGVWVSQGNADNANTDASFMSFDVGAAPVNVYIAYDPAGGPPTAAGFGASALTVGVSDPAIAGGSLSVVEAIGVTGTVTIGGTDSDLTGTARQAYLVIVAP